MQEVSKINSKPSSQGLEVKKSIFWFYSYYAKKANKETDIDFATYVYSQAHEDLEVRKLYTAHQLKQALRRILRKKTYGQLPGYDEIYTEIMGEDDIKVLEFNKYCNDKWTQAISVDWNKVIEDDEIYTCFFDNKIYKEYKYAVTNNWHTVSIKKRFINELTLLSKKRIPIKQDPRKKPLPKLEESNNITPLQKEDVKKWFDTISKTLNRNANITKKPKDNRPSEALLREFRNEK